MQTKQFYGGDRRFGNALFALPKGEGTMEAEQVIVNSGDPGREIWLDKREEEEENLLNVNKAASVFYYDFPLPDFPCMSSSSSSSSTRAPVKATTCSSASSSSSASWSSSAASWAVLKSEDAATDNLGNRTNSHRSDDCDDNGNRIFPHAGEADAPPRALSSTASTEIILEPQPVDPASTDAVGSCIDEMDTFGYMDLLESNDFFDPASIFQSETCWRRISEIKSLNPSWLSNETSWHKQLQLRWTAGTGRVWSRRSWGQCCSSGSQRTKTTFRLMI